MSRGSTKAVSWFAGSAAIVLVGATAWAQDYTVTAATGKLETRPSTGVSALGQINSFNSAGKSVDLPFEFPYYGRLLSRIWLGPGGFLIANQNFPGIFPNPHTNYNAPGRDLTTDAFPYTPQGWNGTANSTADGVIAPFWDSLTIYSTTPASDTYWWIVGTAPNRRFVVSWENFYINGTPSTNPRITAQAHLYESTGRIVFAYSTTGDYSTRGRYVCGIDSFGDARFTAPLLATNLNDDYPGSDFIFDPRTVGYTGKLLFDRIVSDANGIGSSTDANRPLVRCRVELRRDGGIVANSAVTGDDGSFSIAGVGIASTSTGTLQALARNPACIVTTASGGAPSEWAANTNIAYSGGSTLGSIALTASGDSTGAVRAPFHVANVCLAAWDWASARTTAAIPRLDVLVDPTKTFGTAYLANPTAAMYLGSGLSQALDVWDAAVITKTYARHVLASIAALPTTASDDRFDAVTDTQNAFAEAFGYYLWAVISGTSTAIDGTSASAATVHDLETPSISVARGPDVAGCVAGALFDLLDDASEARDAVDGRLTQNRVFQITDGFTVGPTVSTFLQAWIDAGYDAPSITRSFIGDGVVADDASEPNDDRTEASSLGTVGVKRGALLLNRFNEDWFSVTVPAGGSSLRTDVAYDRLSLNTGVVLEIRDAAGTLLATGSPVGTSGPVHAETASVQAGSYRVGVRYISGVTLPTYTVQAYLPLVMDQTPLTDWTVGRPFDQSLGVADGVPGYTLATVGSSLPPGLSFSPLDQHVVGTPTSIGSFGFTIQLQDTGVPANVVTRTRNIAIHDVLKLPIAPFVGFPLGKSGDATLPTTGGTPPFTLGMTSGALPAGLAFDAGSLHVTGTVTAGPSSAFELDGVDVAGSADHVATRGVVAQPASGRNVPADLVAGTDACGWWFDAVQGSKVSFTASTAKRRLKRTLVGAVLAPDRSLVLTGEIKAKLGGLTGGGIVCPLSGRYYVIASGDTGDATQLLGNVKVAPPKAGRSKFPVFAPSDTTTVEVGAVPGAVLTLKFAGQKKTTLLARIVGVTDPTGTPVGTAQFVKATATGGTLTMTLATGGTWTFVLGATSTSGVPGKLSYSYTLKQPKGGTYSAD